VPDSFDRRVLPEAVLAFVRAVQARVPSHLGGGAALSGVHLAHRLSRDIDLYTRDDLDHRRLVQLLPSVAEACGLRAAVVRDAGSFVRATLEGLDRPFEVDVIFDPATPLSPPERFEGVWTESLLDLRASKLTCLLSRSEPRDLVDVLFLERAGFRPEDDLAAAAEKDTGIDPGVLAWLLGQFPVSPLPVMLRPLAEPELHAYRDALRERLRAVAVP
jgi:hypothetical protein